MTKLLYITATLPYGTGEAFLAAEVDELIRLGCDVRLVPRARQGDFIHNDVRHLQERTESIALLSIHIILSAFVESVCRPLAALQSLTTIFRSGNVKTILKNLAVFPKALWLARLARRWGAEHIHAHWLSTPATIAMIASKLSGIPWSCTAHRVDIVHNNLLAQKLASAQFVRFISESGRAMAFELGMKDPSDKDSGDKAIVLHVGVTLPHDISGEAVNSNAVPPTILCAANLYPVKGHKYLIEAAGLLRDRGVEYTIKIAGRGECQCDLETLVKELKLDDQVQFVGQLSHDELLAMYRRRQVQIAVLPSIDLGDHLHEGIPVTLMEPMACGIPVVSTATGGIPELLSDGAGVLVAEKNPTALADALERLIADAELREKIGMAGRQRVAACFDVRTISAELLQRIQSAPELTHG